MQSHKHAELIKKWAAGFEVERLQNGEWIDDFFPSWMDTDLFRLKELGQHNDAQCAANHSVDP